MVGMRCSECMVWLCSCGMLKTKKCCIYKSLNQWHWPVMGSLIKKQKKGEKIYLQFLGACWQVGFLWHYFCGYIKIATLWGISFFTFVSEQAPAQKPVRRMGACDWPDCERRALIGSLISGSTEDLVESLARVLQHTPSWHFFKTFLCFAADWLFDTFHC